MHLSDSLPTTGEQELTVRDWLNRTSEEQDCQDNQYLYRRCQSYILNILQLLDPEGDFSKDRQGNWHVADRAMDDLDYLGELRRIVGIRN
ncbi:hypothetical protein [Schaalia odontolytica]